MVASARMVVVALLLPILVSGTGSCSEMGSYKNGQIECPSCKTFYSGSQAMILPDDDPTTGVYYGCVGFAGDAYIRAQGALCYSCYEDTNERSPYDTLPLVGNPFDQYDNETSTMGFGEIYKIIFKITVFPDQPDQSSLTEPYLYLEDMAVLKPYRDMVLVGETWNLQPDPGVATHAPVIMHFGDIVEPFPELGQISYRLNGTFNNRETAASTTAGFNGECQKGLDQYNQNTTEWYDNWLGTTGGLWLQWFSGMHTSMDSELVLKTEMDGLGFMASVPNTLQWANASAETVVLDHYYPFLCHATPVNTLWHIMSNFSQESQENTPQACDRSGCQAELGDPCVAGSQNSCCVEGVCEFGVCANPVLGGNCDTVTPCFCSEGPRPAVEDGQGGCTCDGVCTVPGASCGSVTPCFCPEGNKPEVEDGQGGCTCDGVCDVIGGCAGTEHGCCPDGTTACADASCTNCNDGASCGTVTPCFCPEGNKPEVEDGQGGCTCDGVCDDECGNMCGENTSCDAATGMCTSDCVVAVDECCATGGAACGAIPGTEWTPTADCVCGFDPWCCVVAWDGQCVQEAIDTCGAMCG